MTVIWLACVERLLGGDTIEQFGGNVGVEGRK